MPQDKQEKNGLQGKQASHRSGATTGTLARATSILPRLIRFRDAPNYLGMDRNRFNSEVRPYVTESPIGRQGIAFDRIELDAWVDHYMSCNGRPALKGGKQKWDATNREGSDFATVSTTSKSESLELQFAKAVKRAIS